MTKRKNLKIDPNTYDDLCDEKRKHETWDHFFNRLLREASDE